MTPEGKTCEECGKRISKARLKAIPDATLCVRCREVQDVRPICAQDVWDVLVVRGEFTPGETSRLLA